MIVLGDNRYGKAETRLVRVDRGADAHHVTDLTVTTALAGDLARTHLTGDNSGVLPTDTQKNTVFAFARDGIGDVESFALRLARHFVETVPTVHRARVHVDAHSWDRVAVGGAPSYHSFRRAAGTRSATVTVAGDDTHVVSGVDDLVLMNTTDSQFHGFLRDSYTTLPEATDRILATAVSARWRHGGAEPPTDGWSAGFDEALRHLVEAFADTPSLSLQQTLYAMGERVLTHRAELVEVRLALPNKHHFLVDLAPFGLDNPGEVFFAADRPYGLIEGTVLRDDAASAEIAW